MTTRHRVDPDLLDLVDSITTEDLTLESLELLRRSGLERLSRQAGPPVAPRARQAPGFGQAPPVPVLHYRPARQQQRSAAILHIHGGGMISGSARLSEFASAAQALEAGLPVFSVEYRLAPETPFPGQLEDCYAVLAWMTSSAEAFDIDPGRIIVSGDSAGGGLAAGLALMVRDRGDLSLVGQVLTYPMLDYRTALSGELEAGAETGEFCWTRQQNSFAWSAYRGDFDLDDPRRGWFSPALASDLAGLPPAWIGVGMLDLFRDECISYAHRLRTAGIAAELQLYDGAPHAFNAHPRAGIAGAYRAGVSAAFKAFAAHE